MWYTASASEDALDQRRAACYSTIYFHYYVVILMNQQVWFTLIIMAITVICLIYKKEIIQLDTYILDIKSSERISEDPFVVDGAQK